MYRTSNNSHSVILFSNDSKKIIQVLYDPVLNICNNLINFEVLLSLFPKKVNIRLNHEEK